MEIKIDSMWKDQYKQLWKVLQTGSVEMTTGAVKDYVTLHNLSDNQLRTVRYDTLMKPNYWSVVTYREADEAPKDVTDTIYHIMNNAEHEWNDKELVCVSVWGSEGKPENVQNILKQNNIDKKDVMKLAKLGIVQSVVLDDMAVIIKMDYTRVLNATDYSEEYLLNLG